MLKDKNKVRGEIKLVDKEEDPLEPFRRFLQVNEDAKKSYDEYAAKIKRGEDMKNLMREAEAKIHPDLDSDKYKDLDSDSQVRIQIENHLHLMILCMYKSLK